MKKYCFDTSGISNPLETMPDDIHESIWLKFNEFIVASWIAVTFEIHEKMKYVRGIAGACIAHHKPQMVLEVDDDSWDWRSYVNHARTMQLRH